MARKAITQDVNMVDVEALEGHVGNLGRALGRGHVGLDDEDLSLANSSLDILCSFGSAGCCGFGDVVEDDAGACTCQLEGNAGANTVLPSGAGDDGDLAGEGEGILGRHGLKVGNWVGIYMDWKAWEL